MKDVVGFEGLYAITSCGKVWSYKSKRFRKIQTRKDGYQHIQLHKDGKVYTKYIHILVAEAYIPNPENKPEVDHIKSDEKSNNNVNNLRWVSSAENKVNRKERGEKVRTKIRCVETGVIYKSCADAARAVGVHKYRINCAVNGQTQTSAGYHWERVYENEKETNKSA